MQQNRSSTNKIPKKWDQIHRSQTDTYEVHWTKLEHQIHQNT